MRFKPRPKSPPPLRCATLAEVEAIDREMLTADNISKVIRIEAHGLRIMARDGLLPFPAICNGSRVLIPKAPFLAYMRGTETETGKGVN